MPHAVKMLLVTCAGSVVLIFVFGPVPTRMTRKAVVIDLPQIDRAPGVGSRRLRRD